MAQQGDAHSFTAWAKHRLDEMDATLASLEDETGRLQAELRTEAAHAIAGLKRRRDAFGALAKAEAESGEAALHDARAQLETEWARFAAELESYFATFGAEFEHQYAAFRAAAAAQAKSWHAVAEELQAEAAGAAAVRGAQIDDAIRQLKEDAAAAEARLHRLKDAGSESWAALSTALAESRHAFERAAHQAWEALKAVTSAKS